MNSFISSWYYYDIGSLSSDRFLITMFFFRPIPKTVLTVFAVEVPPLITLVFINMIILADRFEIHYLPTSVACWSWNSTKSYNQINVAPSSYITEASRTAMFSEWYSRVSGWPRCSLITVTATVRPPSQHCSSLYFTPDKDWQINWWKMNLAVRMI